MAFNPNYELIMFLQACMEWWTIDKASVTTDISSHKDTVSMMEHP